MDSLADNALMLKVKDGDLDKLGLLYERYKRPLYGFFYGMNKSQELSEDLVQNVFLRILKYRYLFRGEPAGRSGGGDFKTWMFHIARNVSHDHHRKNKIKNSIPIEEWQGIHEDNKSTQWQHDDELHLLSLAMDRLPEDKKEILMLSKFYDKKYKEIGDMVGCTEGAVKVKVFRAIQELKEIYQQLEKHM